MNPKLAKAGLGILRETTSLAGGALAGAFSLLKNTILEGSKQLMKFHQEGIAFSRDMGMSLNQANAYTKALAENTSKLAFKYGVTAEAIMKVQRGLSEATNRQLMLNNAQTESFVQLNKLAGENTVAKFAEEMMQGMGAQVDTVEGAIAKAYATSAKSGLSAKKTAEIVANNLNMVNKLSFRSGVDGLTRMAVQAQKIGMSLQSVESVAKTFMDFDSAIEHSAQLQMLGGAAGSFGGNPLDMMYEANYDPEALQDRMTKMLSGYAQFDEKTGMSKINGLGMDFVRNIAKAMGISEEEATKIAKKNSELKYKEQRFGGSLSNYSEEQQNWLMNKSYVRDGKMYITTADNEEHEITGGKLDDAVLKEMKQFAGMSDSDIMKKQASELSSINEKIQAFFDSVYAKIAKKFADFIPTIQDWITKNGNNLLTKIESGIETVASKLPQYWKDFKEFIKSIKSHWEALKTTLKVIGAGVTTIAAVWAGKSLAGLFGNVRSAGGALSGPASSIGGAIRKAGNWMHKGSAHEIFKNVYKSTGRLKNQNWWSQTKAGTKAAWKYSSKMAKGTAALGALTGVIQGVGAISEYNRKKQEIENNSNLSQKEKDKALEEIRTDRNSEVGGAVGAGVGTILGTFFFGPLGGMIGGAVGEFTGKFIGQYWDPIVEKVSSFFSGVWNAVSSLTSKVLGGLKSIGEKAMEGIKWLADNSPIGLMVKGVGKIFGKDWSVTGAISSLFGGENEGHANGGIVGTKDNVVGIAKGEIVLSKTMQENLVSLLKNPELSAKSADRNNFTYTPVRAGVSTIGNNTTFKNPEIYAKPVGRNDFTYTPGKTETSTVGNHTMTVKDFNINLGGVLRLDGGGSSTNLDIRQLLNDPTFVNQLKDVVKDSIAADINGGRKMNDFASMRGLPAQTTTWGRK